MSFGSLCKFAQLTGAWVKPSSWLYNNKWPSKPRRLAQALTALVSWFFSCSRNITLTGTRLPASSGHVSICGRPRLSSFVNGVLVIPGASLEKLSRLLDIESTPLPQIYLADADVLVLLATQNCKEVVIHITDDKKRAARYQRGIELANFYYSKNTNDGLIPKVISRKNYLDNVIITQERISGVMKNARDFDAEALIDHVRAALQALPRSRAESISQHPRLASDMEGSWTDLLDNPITASFVISIADYERSVRVSSGSTEHFAHGDYCLSNVIFAEKPVGERAEISGIVDWERSKLDAPFGLDALYFSIFAFSDWKGCSPVNTLCMLWDGDHEPEFKRLLNLIMDTFSLSSYEIGLIGLNMWLRHLNRQLDSIDQWSPDRHSEWLSHPSQCAKRWIDQHQRKKM